jgi:hypothetical protein
LGRRKSRSLARPYTKGELNETVDAFLHPLARVDPSFLVIDGVIHGFVERNPPETVAEFVQYNLPILVAELLRKRKGRMSMAQGNSGSLLGLRPNNEIGVTTL